MPERTEEAIRAQFHRDEPRYRALQQEVEFALAARLAGADIKLHSITGRVKGLDQLLAKAQRKGYTDPLEEAPDVVGVRVVVLFLSDLPSAAKVVRDTFTVTEEDDKIEGPDETTFGYMSIHFVVRIGDALSGPRYDGIKDLRCEIQLRTILMDAWANVHRYLGYQGERSVPSELRKDFNALSGMFYVADKHFELFYAQSIQAGDDAREELRQAEMRPARPVPIDAETLNIYLHARYPDREAADKDDVSQFVEEIVPIGYEQLSDLARRLDEGDKALPNEEARTVRMHRTARLPFYNVVGAARTSLSLADPDYSLPTVGIDEVDIEENGDDGP